MFLQPFYMLLELQRDSPQVRKGWKTSRQSSWLDICNKEQSFHEYGWELIETYLVAPAGNVWLGLFRILNGINGNHVCGAVTYIFSKGAETLQTPQPFPFLCYLFLSWSFSPVKSFQRKWINWKYMNLRKNCNNQIFSVNSFWPDFP